MNELKPCPFCGGKSPWFTAERQYPDTPRETIWYAVVCYTYHDGISCLPLADTELR